MGFERGGNRSGGGRGGFGGGFGGGRSGGRSGGFGGRGGDRGGDRGGFREKPTMHKAVCDECGKECEVPFRPSGDKPIFCDACFGGKREGGRSDSRSPRSSVPAADFSKQFAEINDKLNKLIHILEKSSTPSVKETKVEDTKEVKKSAKKVVAKKAVSKKK